MRTVNMLDVARGTMDESGVTFLWLNDLTTIDHQTFNTFDEMLTYVSGYMDSFNISVEQGHQRRHFTIWEMPWLGAEE